MTVSPRHIFASESQEIPASQSGAVSEIMAEFRWIDQAIDKVDHDRRLAWLGMKVIPSTDRFSLRHDRDGFLIAFPQFGNRLHPFGWTMDCGRARSYRALQQQPASLTQRLRAGLSDLFGLGGRMGTQISPAE